MINMPACHYNNLRMGEITSTCCNPTTKTDLIEYTSNNSELAKAVDQELAEKEPIFEEMPMEIHALIKEVAHSKYATNVLSLDLAYEELPKEKEIIAYRKKRSANHNRDNIVNPSINNECPHETIFLIPHGTTAKTGQSTSVEYNGLFTINFPQKQYYYGQLSNSQPTKGIFVFNSQCYYVGEIKEGLAVGEGKYQNRQNGYTYEGKWSKNLQHGLGRQIYRNGEQYKGEYMYGAKFGLGVYRFADGSTYNGEFYLNQMDGHGTLTLKNGNTYTGEWKLSQMHGKGVFKWSAANETYQGEYKNGKRQGHGKYTFANGSIYEGGWIDGKQDGQGVVREGYDQVSGVWIDGEKVQ